jgi:hypothetical protein
MSAGAGGAIWSPIVELRQYALKPGQRDVLIELFDREFVESQEALGMKLIGQFRAIDHPDRFVWLRGFPDMPTRGRALEAFYGGPVWRRHSAAANETMLDVDNVLLLRPARPGSGFVLDDERPSPESTTIPDGLVVATIYRADESDVEPFAARLEAALADAGIATLAVFVTENAANNFPALPIREEEHVVVSFTSFADEGAHERHARPFPEQCDEVLRLRPTSRSLCTAGPRRRAT